MTIGEVIQKHPEAIEKLFRFGMGCAGCPSRSNGNNRGRGKRYMVLN